MRVTSIPRHEAFFFSFILASCSWIDPRASRFSACPLYKRFPRWRRGRCGRGNPARLPAEVQKTARMPTAGWKISMEQIDASDALRAYRAQPQTRTVMLTAGFARLPHARRRRSAGRHRAALTAEGGRASAEPGDGDPGRWKGCRCASCAAARCSGPGMNE